MQVILTLWLLICAVLFFIKIKWGIALLMVYFLLVPGFNIGIQGLGGGQNVLFLLLLAAYFQYCSQKRFKTDYLWFSPFITLFIIMLIATPFQNGMPLSDNVLYWTKNVIDSIIFPFVLFNVMMHDNSAFSLFNKVFYGCIVIALGYALLQIVVLGGSNPYTLYMQVFLGIDNDFESYYASGNRLFGRVSSVFMHPMTFAMFLGCAIIYLFYLIQKTKNTFNIVLFLVALIVAILCGVRSILGGLAFAITYFLFASRQIKIIVWVVIGAFILYVIVTSVPKLNVYLGSLVGQSDVGGSSIEMRLKQFDGAVDEMMNNPVFGLGNQWTKYYVHNYGDHPVCLAFESLVFVVLCNYGIIGVINYGIMGLRFFKNNSLLSKRNKSLNGSNYILNSFFVFYFAYSCITGDYGYIKYLLIFYVMTIGSINKGHYKMIKQTSNYNIYEK